ncbi:MAG TPA: 50S ribosomal protein L10 [Armatimonadota bacterium]|jgi:large subunit ribosomal protein L10
MPTPQKEQLVAQVGVHAKEAAAFYLVSFTGLSVADMNDLRGQVLQAGGNLQVVKNRLIKLALGEDLATQFDADLKGPTLIAFCEADPVGPAQVLSKFGADHPGLVIKAGYVDGSVLNAAQAAKVATLPPREMILAETLGVISSPLSGLVGIFNAAISELVYVMDAAIEKKQGGEEAA